MPSFPVKKILFSQRKAHHLANPNKSRFDENTFVWHYYLQEFILRTNFLLSAVLIIFAGSPFNCLIKPTWTDKDVRNWAHNILRIPQETVDILVNNGANSGRALLRCETIEDLLHYYANVEIITLLLLFECIKKAKKAYNAALRKGANH